MEASIFLILAILIGIFIIWYFFRILKNILLILIFLIIVCAIFKIVFHIFLGLEIYLFILLLAIILYLLFEIINIFVNVGEIFKEIVLLLLYPFRAIKNLLKSKKDNKKDE